MTTTTKNTLAVAKNKVRQELASKGVLKKEGRNTYDKYTYFSEAQYKQLFTELFAKHGIELTFSVAEVVSYQGTGNQPNGRLCKCDVTLTHVASGETETASVYGDALDRGDKALYKAYTGAIKYFLANTFMVATGDDPERDSEPKDTPAVRKARSHVARLEDLPTERQAKLCAYYKVDALTELTEEQRKDALAKING